MSRERRDLVERRDYGTSRSSDGNTAAWHPPTTTPGKNSNDSASLAQTLGSQGSWADRIFPSDDSQPATASSEGLTVHTHFNTDQPQDFRSPVSRQVTEEHDPPPAYSASTNSRIHELAADPLSNVSNADMTSELQTPHSAHPPATNLLHEAEQHDVRSPLLEHHQSDRRACGSKRWRICAGRCIKMFALTLGMLLVVGIVVCAMVTRKDSGDTYVKNPKPSIPDPSDKAPERKYEQHETHKNITGTYPLYELLDLSTSTGNIDIEIDPKPGDKPAVLRLSTKSGSIRARLSSTTHIATTQEQDFLSRRFETSIDTEFGHIVGDFLVGNGGYMNTSTRFGSMTLKLLAVGVGPFDETSSILTTSIFGLQNITLQSVGGAYPVTNIKAEHRASGTASLDITYPPEWLGKVHAVAAGLGDVRVSGNNLTYHEKNSWEIRASRGTFSKQRLVKVDAAGTGSAWFDCS